jgi:hypothetical protein
MPEDADLGVVSSIDLWTKMLIADAVHENTIIDNVTHMENR